MMHPNLTTKEDFDCKMSFVKFELLNLIKQMCKNNNNLHYVKTWHP
jgi:hypothetical protein